MAFVIGLIGGSASGKSRFIRELANFLGEHISILSIDDYYKKLADQQKDGNGHPNFDLPEAIELDKLAADLKQLKAGYPIELEEYTFNNPNRQKGPTKRIESRDIILVEGLFTLHFEEIDRELDMRLFIHADETIRYQRRLERDLNERGIPMEMIEYQWNEHVKPCYDHYLAPHMSRCDLVINNNHSFDEALRTLQAYLQTKLVWQTNSQ